MDWKRLAQFALRGSSDLEQYAILLARVSLGNKLFVASGAKPIYETLVKAEVPFPRQMAYFVSGVEFAGGSLLTAGFFRARLRGFIDRYDCRRPDERAFHHA